MGNEWLKKQVEIFKINQENLELCHKNNLKMLDFEEHIEVYDKNDKLLKVLYSPKSLNFYLKSVNG
ncbi:hypothetical protein L1999_20270 [Neobacillus drentensis]|uniref:hypothetical protein n=1 Tax=Neobacillus drentensis TaxID=220684 RepID=UPI001F3CB5DC|nr:hypothetical protein [Neobacillus drentensis]ULT55420.1 hypothetical protein L1999_20270 [Neobacillus drentensis]